MTVTGVLAFIIYELIIIFIIRDVKRMYGVPDEPLTTTEFVDSCLYFIVMGIILPVIIFS